jgi:histidine triad (HIT) family protein
MTSPECIFCGIAAGDVAAEILFQDDALTAFRDIQPVAPTHVLIIPNRHIDSIRELEAQDEALVGCMFSLARQIAVDEGIEDSGYRLIINNGTDAGQVVFHLHLHLMGGQPMRYPMG